MCPYLIFGYRATCQIEFLGMAGWNSLYISITFMILVDYDGIVSDGTVYQLPVHFCHVSFMIRRMYCLLQFSLSDRRPWLGLPKQQHHNTREGAEDNPSSDKFFFYFGCMWGRGALLWYTALTTLVHCSAPDYWGTLLSTWLPWYTAQYLTTLVHCSVPDYTHTAHTTLVHCSASDYTHTAHTTLVHCSHYSSTLLTLLWYTAHTTLVHCSHYWSTLLTLLWYTAHTTHTGCIPLAVFRFSL